MEKSSKGFTSIYNLDYDEAEQAFLALQREYPNHPAPPLYLATIVMLRTLMKRGDLSLNRFVSPSYFTKKTDEEMRPENRKAFFDYIQQSQALSNNILKQHPQDLDARYFLGSAHGILAAFAITVDHSLREAFREGNRAYKYQSQILKADPEYFDACLAVGLYQYIVGSIPWYLKWLAALIGYRGSKEKGIEYLQTAIDRGQYVSNDARVLLMVIYVRGKQYANALEQVEILHRQFPRNYIFAINKAQIHQKMGDTKQAATDYLQVVLNAEQGLPNYRDIPLGIFRYQIAEQLFKIDRIDVARQLFEKSVTDARTPEREMALSHLQLGKILDLQGRRDDALEQYRTVLTLRDFDLSHRQAHRYMRSPYTKE